MNLHRLWRTLVLLMLTLASGTALAGWTQGVRAEYWNWSGSGTPAIPATAATVDQLESTINRNNVSTAPAPGITATNHMARYTGYLSVPVSGYYEFNVLTDDGVRLAVDCNNDGQLTSWMIDRWQDTTPVTWSSTASDCYLTKGQYYRFRYDMYNRGAQSSARLSWTRWSSCLLLFMCQDTNETVIGASSYFQPDTTPPTGVSALIGCGGGTSVTLTFSETLDPATVTVTGFLVNGLAPRAVKLSDDETQVTLTTAVGVSTGQTVTINPAVAVTKVKDQGGNAVATGSTLSVTGGSGTLTLGVLGTYFDQNNTAGNQFGGGSATRVDSTINFSWGNGGPGVGAPGTDRFSVRWTGYILIPSTGTYTFQTVSDDGVRLTLNGDVEIDNWTDHTSTTNTTASLSLSAGTYLPFTLEYYDSTGSAGIQLLWKKPTDLFFAGHSTIPSTQLYRCYMPLAGFRVTPGSSSASTCGSADVTVTAIDSAGATYTGYSGTVSLGTSSGLGTWSTGSPAAVLPPVDAVANDGAATQVFSALDKGVVRLKLASTLAGSLTVTARDPLVSGATGTSSAIGFADNAFVFTETGASPTLGSGVGVAGRPHGYSLKLVRKDPSTGQCGTATDYLGVKTLKFWRTDVTPPASGSWTAPSVVLPVLSVPATTPAAGNLNLTFVAGVGSFQLATTDIGRYSLNALDPALGNASGSSSTLTVRPFALAASDIRQGSALNPGVLDTSLTAFAAAGTDFSATVGAYRWSLLADADNDGVPDATATLAALQAAGTTAGFGSTVTLAPLAGSQRPAGGSLGTLDNAGIAGSRFSAGLATATTLRYSEVGSFSLATTGVVSDFLGSGQSLDAVVFGSTGLPNTAVGRFRPAKFVVSSASVTHRSGASCSPASTFTYLGENFLLNFVLTAQNGVGATTTNYFSGHARLDLGSPLTWNLAGKDGSTVYSALGTGARLSVGSASGSWNRGVSSTIVLPAQLVRGSGVSAPISLALGIAPVDLDGTTMGSFDLDVDPLVGGNDRSTVATVALRQGRLRLLNAIGPQDRDLAVPLVTQYWSGSTWATNTLDSCTRVPTAALAFANPRKSLTLADLAARSPSVALSAGRGLMWMNKPAGGRRGSADLTLALGSTALSNSCLIGGVTGLLSLPATGASLAHLRGDWCGSGSDRDPLARLTFGLFRGADSSLDLRENF